MVEFEVILLSPLRWLLRAVARCARQHPNIHGPLPRWARVAPPLVVGSSLRDSDRRSVPISMHKNRKSLQIGNGISGKSFLLVSEVPPKVPKGRDDFIGGFNLLVQVSSPIVSTKALKGRLDYIGRFQPPEESISKPTIYPTANDNKRLQSTTNV